ncbi:MAG: hypothetical protein IKM43_02595 [Clostridia bacterium]|nr:hypothetical protein [Clostridia bacterium]
MLPGKNKTLRTYIAIDSCVLNIFVEIERLCQKFDCDPLEIPERKIDSNIFEPCSTKNFNKKDIAKFYLNLYSMVKKDTVRLFVSPAVLSETDDPRNKERIDFLNFIKNMCYMPHIEEGEEVETLYGYEEVVKLANIYTTPYKYVDKYSRETKTSLPPMRTKLSLYNQKYIPENDAFIMAYATIYGCSLLTENVTDFIYINDGDNIGRRAKCIKHLNIENGYYLEIDTNGYKTACVPISSSLFIQKVLEDHPKFNVDLINFSKAVSEYFVKMPDFYFATGDDFMQKTGFKIEDDEEFSLDPGMEF